MAAWKDAKEAFVSGGSGGGLCDLLVTTAVVPAWFSLRLKVGRPDEGFLRCFAADAALVALPLALVCTLAADRALVLLLLPLALLFFVPRAGGARALALDGGVEGLRAFRSAQAVSVAIVILACDFRAFPRRHLKTEAFGFSLMDLGVGSFVFGNALVADRRSHAPLKRGAAPLAVLGLLRLASLKLLGYPEHVSEYGIHWNFFATAACVDLFHRRLESLPQLRQRPALVSVLLVALREVVVDDAWVLHAQRFVETSKGPSALQSLWHADREGLVSLFGYCAIHCAALAVAGPISRLEAPPVGAADRRGEKAVRSAASSFAVGPALAVSAVACTCLVAVSSGVLEPSRRLANAGYVVLTLGVNCGLVVAFTAPVRFLDIGSFRNRLPRHSLLRLADRHQLAWFVCSNVFCGLANLSHDTMAWKANDARIIIVLCAYVAAVAAAVRFIDFNRRAAVKGPKEASGRPA
ncbi:GWT1-domain-containing protein [Pelagophyceae sp. CCMP2097]|nr:GWT1-domain-containing protein [Pelagophyceae sp. CCMP2097]